MGSVSTENLTAFDRYFSAKSYSDDGQQLQLGREREKKENWEDSERKKSMEIREKGRKEGSKGGRKARKRVNLWPKGNSLVNNFPWK